MFTASFSDNWKFDLNYRGCKNCLSKPTQDYLKMLTYRLLIAFVEIKKVQKRKLQEKYKNKCKQKIF